MTKIEKAVKKIDKQFNKAFKADPRMIAWGVQKKYLSECLVEDKLVEKVDLKKLWRIFDRLAEAQHTMMDNAPSWEDQLDILTQLVTWFKKWSASR